MCYGGTAAEVGAGLSTCLVKHKRSLLPSKWSHSHQRGHLSKYLLRDSQFYATFLALILTCRTGETHSLLLKMWRDSSSRGSNHCEAIQGVSSNLWLLTQFSVHQIRTGNFYPCFHLSIVLNPLWSVRRGAELTPKRSSSQISRNGTVTHSAVCLVFVEILTCWQMSLNHLTFLSSFFLRDSGGWEPPQPSVVWPFDQSESVLLCSGAKPGPVPAPRPAHWPWPADLRPVSDDSPAGWNPPLHWT